MASGNSETEVPNNRRVPKELADEIRRTRAGEPWESYDEVVIGPGANTIDPGWFNSWADLANANEVTFFRSRSSAVGKSYTNRPFDRWDYAFDIHMFGIEYLSPVGFSEYMENVTDVKLMPEWWTRKLPERMPFTVKIADTDEILILPANHAPAGVGPYGGIASADAAQFHAVPVNGQPLWVNRWKLGEPVMVPRASTFVVRTQIDEPWRSQLAAMNLAPGFMNAPTGGPFVVGSPAPFRRIPNWYSMRITLIGVRYVMLRGGYSAP